METQLAPVSMPRIRYARKRDEFYEALAKRVNTYFAERNLTKYATAAMYGKIFFLTAMWFSGFALIMSNQFAGWALIGLQVAWHFTMFLMSVGIAHDGSHQAISRKKWINQFCYYVFDFVGINSYFWEYNHIQSHHNAPNIPFYDSAIHSFAFFRLHPRSKWYPIHRYQHYYIFVLYSMATLFKVFYLDFFSLRRKRIGAIDMDHHEPEKILWLFFTKAFVIGATLVLPLWILDAPVWQILTGYILGHLISGLALGVIFMVTHLCDYTTWPYPDDNGVIDNSFAQHIMETTSDFAPNNRIVTWIAGGLNIHVAHHLFPRISQIHLPALAKIVKEVATEYEVPYKVYPSIWAAVRSHIRVIKELGEEE